MVSFSQRVRHGLVTGHLKQVQGVFFKKRDTQGLGIRGLSRKQKRKKRSNGQVGKQKRMYSGMWPVN